MKMCVLFAYLLAICTLSQVSARASAPLGLKEKLKQMIEDLRDSEVEDQPGFLDSRNPELKASVDSRTTIPYYLYDSSCDPWCPRSGGCRNNERGSACYRYCYCFTSGYAERCEYCDV